MDTIIGLGLYGIVVGIPVVSAIALRKRGCSIWGSILRGLAMGLVAFIAFNVVVFLATLVLTLLGMDQDDALNPAYGIAFFSLIGVVQIAWGRVSPPEAEPLTSEDDSADLLRPRPPCSAGYLTFPARYLDL